MLRCGEAIDLFVKNPIFSHAAPQQSRGGGERGKIMIAKNKSRKSPKTAVIRRSTRGLNSSERHAGAKISVARGHDAPKFFPFAAEELDTVTRSGLALADGIQAFGQALIEMQRRSVSEGLLAARGLVDARNPWDVMELQRRFVTGSLENALRETGDLVQLARRLAAEAWAPRVAAAPSRGSRS
jgi:hypothetical protein